MIIASHTSNAAAQAGVIVVTYNSGAHWGRLVNALKAQTVSGFPVLIVDNASALNQRVQLDGAPDNWRLIQLETNIGFAAANNLAARTLQTEFIVLLNPDAFPEPDWLEHLLSAAKSYPAADAFGCTQAKADAPGVYDGIGDCFWAGGHAFRAGFGRAKNSAPRTGETFSACGAAVMYRRSKYLALGGFDESFFSYSEDVDLGFRLRLAGGSTMQIADAIVHHVGGASAGRRSAFKTYHAARNRIRTFVKNMPAPLLWPLLPVHLALNSAALAHAAASGVFPDTWRGMRDAVAALPKVLKTRAEVQAARTASSLSIARAITWSPLAVAGRKAKIWPHASRS